jgi:virulence factor Mce-like protein
MTAIRGRLGEDRDVLIGGLALLLAAAFVIGGLNGTLRGLFTSQPTRIVRAVFADTQRLSAGDDVRIAGVDAGSVQRITLNPAQQTSTVTISLDTSAGPVYANASASLRYKTVLGGAFYVDLERGTPDRPSLGNAVIPVSRTSNQIELDNITTALNSGAQAGLRTLVREFAQALRNHQAPATLFNTIADQSPGLAAGVGALRGQQQDFDLQTVVRNTAAALGALNTPANDVQTVIAGAAATLQTTAARAGDIRSTLQLAPGTESQVNATLGKLRVTLALADPLIAKLQRPAVQVAPTFSVLRPTLVNASELLNRAVPLLRDLRPATSSLAQTARVGLPLLDAVTVSLDRTNNAILPSLSQVDPGTQKTTAVMIGGTFAGLGAGAGGQMDSNGHFIRFPATLGSSPLNSLPCQLYISNPDAKQLIACNSLGQALSTYLNYNPLGPPPGSSAAPGSGQPTGSHR